MTSETLKTWVGGDGLSHIKKKKKLEESKMSK